VFGARRDPQPFRGIRIKQEQVPLDLNGLETRLSSRELTDSELDPNDFYLRHPFTVRTAGRIRKRRAITARVVRTSITTRRHRYARGPYQLRPRSL
jgi:hypothetical protein